MIFLDRCIATRHALFACAALALGAGCAPQGYSQPPPDAPVAIQSAPVGDPQAAGDVDAEVIYEPDAPVVDIETYPSVVYLGVPTYYVGGRWYRQGPRGWGYYRQEPLDLGRQRQTHEHDAQWTRAREAPLRSPEHVAPAAPQRQPETRAPEHVAPVAPQRQPETRAPERVAPSPQPVAPPRAAPPPAKRNPAPVKPAGKEPEQREPRR